MDFTTSRPASRISPRPPCGAGSWDGNRSNHSWNGSNGNIMGRSSVHVCIHMMLLHPNDVDILGCLHQQYDVDVA